MQTDEYQQQALNTENQDWEGISQRLANPNIIRLLHGAIGVATEAGELLDALKKHIYYGRPLDRINMFEEAGDVMWYLALILSGLDRNFSAVMTANNAKLRARFPEQFNQDQATSRNLDQERSSLEENWSKT